MQTLLASVIAFISTNLDDIFLLTLFFGTQRFGNKEIVIGQYAGIISLIGVSFIASFVGLILDTRYIGLLGLMPVYLGVRGMIRQLRSVHETEESPDSDIPQKGYQQILSVASVTVANGADNISIYTPLFATLALPEKLTMISVFLVMTAIWCLLAKYLTSHPFVERAIKKYGHIAVPYIFILLGIYILYESGTFTLVCLH